MTARALSADNVSATSSTHDSWPVLNIDSTSSIAVISTPSISLRRLSSEMSATERITSPCCDATARNRSMRLTISSASPTTTALRAPPGLRCRCRKCVVILTRVTQTHTNSTPPNISNISQLNTLRGNTSLSNTTRKNAIDPMATPTKVLTSSVMRDLLQTFI